MTRRVRPLTAAIAATLALVATGCGARTAGSDWEGQRGSDWSEYESAYEASWRRGCERASEIGHDLAKNVTPPVCDPAEPPDDPPDVAPLNPEAAGRIDGFVAGLVSGCGGLGAADRNTCIARGGEK